MHDHVSPSRAAPAGAKPDRHKLRFPAFSRKLGRVTFWGVHDGQSWRSYWPVTGRTEYPLLFDRRCQPKPALDAVIKVGRGQV